MIEDQNEFDYSKVDNYLYSDETYKIIIRYRIDEFFAGKDICKEELLRMLSLWEISL